MCFKNSQFQPVFSHHNTFVSCGRLDSVATDCTNEDYVCGKAKMDLVQCLECGFVFNASFDGESMRKEYSCYVPRKVVSPSMNATNQSVKNAIISHCAAINGATTMGGGVKSH